MDWLCLVTGEFYRTLSTRILAKYPFVPRLTQSDAMTNFQQQFIYIGVDLKKDVNYLRSSLTGYSPRDLTSCFGVHSKSNGKITEVPTEAKSFFGEKTEAELSISQDAVARKTLTHGKFTFWGYYPAIETSFPKPKPYFNFIISLSFVV